MKKALAVMTAALLTFALNACAFTNITEGETQTGAQETTTCPPWMLSDEEAASIAAEKESIDAALRQAQQPRNETAGTEQSANPAASGSFGEIKGKTKKGSILTEKDGVTYVDGILIANKTYALPEDYDPGALTDECAEAFDKMAADAYADGISLWVQSGFRSYETQKGLYERYSASDGQDAADRYSARPGHSEHQSGLGIDVNSVSSSFADTAEGKWLAAHCPEYGFILRYPEGKEDKTGYMYEPWHIRYLGDRSLAREITDSGLTLEEYFGITSEYIVAYGG